MPRHEPERTCIVTRRAGPPGGLLRFVIGPDGAVVPDIAGRLPGRGAWVTPTAAAVGQAVKRKAFSRAFKQEVAAGPDLPEIVDAALLRDVRGALALANKAGAALAGFGKVEAAIGSGEVAALLHAREAADDGRRKLAAALRRRGPDTMSAVPTFDDLGGDDLDVALGRSGVVHAALLAGPGSQGCLARWRRLRIFRGLDGAADGRPDTVGGNRNGRDRPPESEQDETV